MSLAPNTPLICFRVLPSAPFASMTSALVRLNGDIIKFSLPFCLSTCSKSKKAISFADLKSCLITESSGDIPGCETSSASSIMGEFCFLCAQLVDASKNADIKIAIALYLFLFICF